MNKVFSLQDIQDVLDYRSDAYAQPDDARLSASARDLLRELETAKAKKSPAVSARKGAVPAKVTPQSSPAELEAFFNSPAIHEVKLQMCDIGRRMWQRSYVDGNGGNIAVRVADELAVCTPTLISKGFMKPEDMCLSDLDGRQLAGTRSQTSEISMHLQIMKRQPRAVASVHCHAPHTTAFSITGMAPPSCMIPEMEIQCGKIPVAEYRTPGTAEMGKLIAELADQHNTILMANHGVVAWSHLNVEDAYWKMEIIEAYCHTVLVASQLGRPLNAFSPANLLELLKTKEKGGIPDPRHGLTESELSHSSEFRLRGKTAAPPQSKPQTKLDPQSEAIVQAVTERILAMMK